MKKKTKILLSILGVFLILIAATTVFLASQGFFKHIKSPEIESIGFADSNPVSVKDLEAAKAKDLEMYPGELHEDYYLNFGDAGLLEGTGIEYTYEVTYTNGLTQEISSLEIGGTKTEDGMHTVFVSAYVSYNDYIKAKEEGKDTIPVYIEAEIYKADYDPAPADYYEGMTVKKYTDGFVEEIEPLFDKELTVKGTEYEFEKKKFRVKYTDGTEKILSPVSHKDKNIYQGYDYRRYSLDGTYIVLSDMSTEEGLILTVRYLDSKTEFKVKSVYTEGNLPIEKIEINDYEIDANTGKDISEVTYTVTKKDGTAVEITSKADGNGDFDSGYVDGCTITVKAQKSRKPSGIVLGVGLSKGLGFDAYDVEQIETPEKITLLDIIDFEYLGAIFFAFLQGIPEMLS